MKKTILSAALAAVAAVVSIPSAAAADGTITFTGNITADTCTVKGGNPGSPTAASFTVTLPNVDAPSLGAANQIAGTTPFQIVIGGPGQTGCTNGKTVRANWEAGPTIDAVTGALKNTAASSPASNVQIALFSQGGTIINLAGLYNDPSNPSAVIASNAATLNYQAAYKATGAATAGAVASQVNYSVTYN